jgi:CBS domain containing-hemolysin-like protein
VLTALNGLANVVLRLANVRPQDQLAQAHGPEELRMLLEQSAEHGLLAADQQQLLTSMLELQGTTVADVMEPVDRIVSVRREDGADRIEAVSRDSGRSRLAVLEGSGLVAGMVHVREAVRATTAGRAATAEQLMTPVFSLAATATVTEAVAAMRARQAQLALVTDRVGAGRAIGFVALEDLLEEVIGEFDDETDQVPRGRRLR